MACCRSIVALFLALLWLPATAHCRIEQLTGSALFACSDHDQDHDSDTATHLEASPGDGNAHHRLPGSIPCDDDPCATVEDGNYRSDGWLLSLPRPEFAAWPGVLSPLASLPARRDQATRSVSPDRESPPWVPASWSFLTRTALPVRAPSLSPL